GLPMPGRIRLPPGGRVHQSRVRSGALVGDIKPGSAGRRFRSRFRAAVTGLGKLALAAQIRPVVVLAEFRLRGRWLAAGRPAQIAPPRAGGLRCRMFTGRGPRPRRTGLVVAGRPPTAVVGPGRRLTIVVVGAALPGDGRIGSSYPALSAA